MKSRLVSFVAALLAPHLAAQSRVLIAGTDLREPTRFALTADGRVAVAELANAFTHFGLFSVATDTIRPAFLLDSRGRDFQVFGAGVDVLYVRSPQGGGSRLLRRPADRPGPVVDLSQGISVGKFLLAPDERSVAFGGGGNRLYVSPIDGSTPPLEVGAGLMVPLASADMTFSSDSTHLLFQGGSGVLAGLYSVPSDGSALPVLLEPASLAYGLNNVLSTGAGVVLFEGFDVARQSRHVYSVPIGGGTVRRISGNSANVYWGSLSASVDGTQALYLSFETGGARWLYRAPTDGSSAPVVLNTPLPWVDVRFFALAPGGTEVLYVADEAEDERDELWVARLDGASAPRRLHAALPFERDVSDYLVVAPLVGRVLFLSDVATDERWELFSVPIDGSAPPVRLCAPLSGPVDRQVSGLRLERAGRHVLYVANEDSPYGELHRAPVDGSFDAVRLSSTASTGPTGDSDERHGKILFANRGANGLKNLYLHDQSIRPAR